MPVSDRFHLIRLKTKGSPILDTSVRAGPDPSRRWLSHKPGSRLPLFSARPAVTYQPQSIANLCSLLNYTARWQRHVYENHLPAIVTWQCDGVGTGSRTTTSRLWIRRPSQWRVQGMRRCIAFASPLARVNLYSRLTHFFRIFRTQMCVTAGEIDCMVCKKYLTFGRLGPESPPEGSAHGLVGIHPQTHSDLTITSFLTAHLGYWRL